MNPVYLIPLFPLAGFLLTGLLRRHLSKHSTVFLSCLMPFLSFGTALALAGDVPMSCKVFSWSGSISLSFVLDRLSLMMCIMISGIGGLIHIYSAGYMAHDAGIKRYFSYLNLFLAFMLTLVLGDNLWVMFIGWEGVGLTSYLLIGFWFDNITNAKAATKAFIVNRVGDVGMLIAMFLLSMYVPSLNLQEICAYIPAHMSAVPPRMVELIALLLFLGACGKSAQIPLHIWLPDAMSGPTPVSALIHAATMVTAGVYMIARLSALYSVAPLACMVIAYIGVATALMAAMIALVQNDIKRILAYSTVSQLGYMFAALGAGFASAAMFHLFTHAFFKALLFLSAGALIHALGGEQDIRKMGGLAKKLPVVSLSFLTGALALAGIPPFSGFFSKDSILLAVARIPVHGTLLVSMLLLGVLLTATYITRGFVAAFLGKGEHHHVHAPGFTMTFPLVLLSIGAAAAGLLRHVDLGAGFIQEFEGGEWPAHAALALAALGAGLGYAGAKYGLVIRGAIGTVLERKFFFDDFNGLILIPLARWVATNIVCRAGDGAVINGTLNGLRLAAGRVNNVLLKPANGNVQLYLLIVCCALLILYFWGALCLRYLGL